jgi:ATP-dependent DNA helicase RecQ
MGYDKPDLAFCLHVGSPGSPVDYYQQVGRAGRALDSAVVTLLPAASDERIWEWFATASVPKEDEALAVLASLADSDSAMSVPSLESATGVRRSRVELLVKILAVDGAVQRTTEGWSATGQAWAFDRPRYAELVAARRAESGLMREYARQATCLETLLRRALDDDVAPDARCGRCSSCTGTLPGGLAASPAQESVLAATDYLRGLDVVLEPRKLWAAGLVDRKGRIAPGLAARPGRALAFADDPGWSDIAGLLSDGAVDRPLPSTVVDGVIAVLGRWSSTWADRPTIVVPLPSIARPQAIAALTERLAEVGRLEVVQALEQCGPRPAADTSPAARARAVQRRLRLRMGVSLPPVTVLLVDDTYRTGWTMTIAAALLREAGASAVLPLVIHQRP